MFFGTTSGAVRVDSATGGRAASRQQILGRQYQPFSNPFFDHASTYLPSSVKALFGFCRHLYMTHGLIHAIVTKVSEYPVTDLILQHPSEGMQRRWNEFLLESFDYRTLQFEVNLDYNITGNAFASPNFPFRKMLRCGVCSADHVAIETRPYWRYINHKFWLQCPKCGQSDYAKAEDKYYPVLNGLGMMRWNPENITLFYNEVTGRTDYALELSNGFRAQITSGRKDLIATTPSIFLEAVRTRRSIILDRNQVFHMKRPSPSSVDAGWGVPSLMPVLKDAYYMQVMKKAQEAVLLTHILPQVFLFPQPATAGADPFVTANLQNWRGLLQREIARQRADPAYYGVLPFPVGHQTIGENGRSLLLMPEIQQMAELLVVGMGFPVDLIFGNGGFAGNSVSMRMLENSFANNMRSQLRLLKWSLRKFSSFLGWPMPAGRFKPFRMADDLQRQALFLQMAQLGKVSDSTLLQQFEIKPEDEYELQMSEFSQRAEVQRKQQMLQASIQGEMQVQGAKFQAKAQQALADAMQSQQTAIDPFAESQQSPGANPGMSLDALASALAARVRDMPPEQGRVWMEQLRKAEPAFTDMVEGQMPVAGMAQEDQQAMGSPVDMTPMPEQLPPRRPGGV